MELKELRQEKRLTQVEAAKRLGVSLRSYKSYENELSKRGTLKYRYLVDTLSAINPIDETHGILTIENISTSCANVFGEYPISFCYLFGSYAKGRATEESDIDLLVSSEVRGMRFFGMVEKLKGALRKHVDVLNVEQLLDNKSLLDEILADGIKIYG